MLEDMLRECEAPARRLCPSKLCALSIQFYTVPQNETPRSVRAWKRFNLVCSVRGLTTRIATRATTANVCTTMCDKLSRTRGRLYQAEAWTSLPEDERVQPRHEKTSRSVQSGCNAV